jgi:uncharacterized protein (DUF1015 family)
MAVIKPFKAIRPVRDKVHLVASRAVNTYKKNILQAKLQENPYSFLHIILPEFGKKALTKPNSVERFQLVKKKFDDFVHAGIFQKDKKDCFYLYKQIKNNHPFTGIIAGASVDDYLSGTIKIHEQTLTKRQEIFKKYLEVCGFNAEPVLLTYPENKQVEKLIAKYTQIRPEYEFTTSDTITHLLWIIDDKKDIQKIISEFSKINTLYIADGHHRSASSALLARERRKLHADKNAPHNFFMSFFINEKQLKIHDFNRVVKDLNGLSTQSFIKKISKHFNIKKTGKTPHIPSQKHEISMYLKDGWYLLTPLKSLTNNQHPVDSLDAKILSDYILSPVLAIHDLKTDTRINFVNGTLGLEELRNIVDSGKAAVAFALYKVTIDDLKRVADTNNIMPPKTTYIEPKLRSGLIIQSII